MRLRLANNGRSSAIRFCSTVIPLDQPIRSAITVAGMSGTSFNSLGISGSTASTIEPCSARSYFGGVSESSAARTVFRAIPNLRAIVLTPNPSALGSRRISAQSSALINLQSSRPTSDQDRTSSTISGGPDQDGVSIHPVATAGSLIRLWCEHCDGRCSYVEARVGVSCDDLPLSGLDGCDHSRCFIDHSFREWSGPTEHP